ncbi:MAG: hypothetical protein NTY69_07830 [Methylococcales bacterium]|nr:hypothetical protein [Methylococcales bacterium]
MAEVIGGIGLFWMVFLIALGVLWFLLPFAVFGIKARLDRQILEQEKTNHLLVELIESNNRLNHVSKYDELLSK